MTRNKVELNAFDKARTALILDQPWWGSLALRLRIEAHPAQWFLEQGMPPTACVDGVTLWYCTEFFEALTPGKRMTVIAHEVYHAANGHMVRRSHRDPEMWNQAADHVCNLELRRSNFEPMTGFSFMGQPFDWLCDPRFDNMPVEQVYAILEKEKMQEDPSGNGQGKGKAKVKVVVVGNGPGSGKGWDMGHVKDAPAANAEQPLSPQQLEEDWKIAVQEATEVARKAGTLPAGLSRMADRLRQPQTDWREVLRKWISVVGDYSWTRPNRRHIANGLYLPGSVKTRLRALDFAIDTSGSISTNLLALAAAELESIFQTEERPAMMRAIYCDARIAGVDEIEGTIQFNPRGGGGTAFQPVFDYIEEQGVEPDCLIYFTDTESSDLGKIQDPGYPVLWLIPQEYAGRTMPFGEVVVLTEY